MSSKFGHFWRTLLSQLFHKRDTSAPDGGFCCRRVSEPPQTSSIDMVLFGFRGSTTYTSSLLRLYCSRMRHSQEKDQPSTSTFFFFPGWAKWMFGSLLSLLVPSWNELKTLEDEAEMVIEEAENVAKVVEEVAELTEKVSAEIAEKLPEKSKLKEAAQVVENYSKEVAHDAHLTQDILHKVEEWKQKLDTSETIVNEQIKKK
ncbi:uncharacterized protein LOC120078589 [Benincasa hispida]|uniref:uncharacterized protein LOC120078589 n=1 Tax=Benincasa hispida TaxID=102211 RepID=UPI001900257D|nr:uncharacterized protein LOC120078589 [Benincasa hispida]